MHLSLEVKLKFFPQNLLFSYLRNLIFPITRLSLPPKILLFLIIHQFSQFENWFYHEVPIFRGHLIRFLY